MCSVVDAVGELLAPGDLIIFAGSSKAWRDEVGLGMIVSVDPVTTFGLAQCWIFWSNKGKIIPNWPGNLRVVQREET